MRYEGWVRWRIADGTPPDVATRTRGAGRELMGDLMRQLELSGNLQGILRTLLPDGTSVVARYDGTTPIIEIAAALPGEVKPLVCVPLDGIVSEATEIVGLPVDQFTGATVTEYHVGELNRHLYFWDPIRGRTFEFDRKTHLLAANAKFYPEVTDGLVYGVTNMVYADDRSTPFMFKRSSGDYQPAGDEPLYPLDGKADTTDGIYYLLDYLNQNAADERVMFSKAFNVLNSALWNDFQYNIYGGMFDAASRMHYNVTYFPWDHTGPRLNHHRSGWGQVTLRPWYLVVSKRADGSINPYPDAERMVLVTDFKQKRHRALLRHTELPSRADVANGADGPSAVGFTREHAHVLGYYDRVANAPTDDVLVYGLRDGASIAHAYTGAPMWQPCAAQVCNTLALAVRDFDINAGVTPNLFIYTMRGASGAMRKIGTAPELSGFNPVTRSHELLVTAYLVASSTEVLLFTFTQYPGTNQSRLWMRTIT